MEILLSMIESADQAVVHEKHVDDGERDCERFLVA